jgi:hypothetical protein
MKTPNLAASLLALACFASAANASSAAPASIHDDQEAGPRFTPDCAHVVFQPEDPPVSKPVPLSSQEWEETCVPAGAQEECWEVAGRTDDLTVRLTLKDRKPLLPWESDVFAVCLDGPALSVRVVSAAYDYAVVRDGAVDGNVVLTPGAKRLLPPDPRGVQGNLTPKMSLVLNDRWAEYYPGQTVYLKVTLKKDVRFWPDETVAEEEYEFPVAASYVVDLAGEAVKPGGFYYVRYSIERLGGTVSSEDMTPELVTPTVAFEPDGALTGL